MFARNSKAGGGKLPKPGSPGLSFIGPEVVISGDVTMATQLHVDGRIDGHVQCARLCLGQSGSVAGNITADEARISGLVEGMVAAKTLTLEASARIKGDISYETISIAAGAQVDGRLARQFALESKGSALEQEGVSPVIVATPIGARKSEGKEEDSRKQDPKLETGPGVPDFFPLPAPRKAAG